MKTILTEIIKKECERYRLIEFGLIPSVEEGVEKLLPLISEFNGDFKTFYLWRQQILKCFYNELEYNSFLCRAKSKSYFLQFIYYMQKRLLNTIHKNSIKAEIDKDLALSNRTIAFKTSKDLTKDTIFMWEKELSDIVSPEELEYICHKFCKTYFPLNLDKLLNRLQKNDSDFWSELFLFIKKLIVNIANKKISTISYKKEIIQDTWEKSSFFIQKKVLEGNLPELKSSLHFRHYILNVCINKCHEAYRENMNEKLVFTNDENIPLENYTFEENANYWSGSLDDVDTNSDSEVSRALAYILWEHLEPYYSRLISGIEEKMKIFFLHYIEDKTYEEIVKMHHPNISVLLSYKLQGKYRQDMVRVRKLLKKRLISILSEE
ncbi:MAG: hypothetical protein SOR57_11910 [Parabacteroides sp.]|nr:hypothetical protein [Parabacteroides sp.]